ncbi:family 20 glycosylhydrolase [Tamlana fucoidanivorans]|uniref:Beta-N-acetylhexosaminidase n=1 Tax=Allotamlana fucoidanivorans TaxID=2583814 RepID=A0A5C4SMF5_9FLAO|nr:family 20 glycosylhydrolase [Tamlana fucoidanivorans]TNJ45266.1 beta-N-acetylhexosaminidase [Tamlana fucoidanivorans]
MNQIILYILLVLGISQMTMAQNPLSNKYDLMPWPKEIKEKPAKFLINSDVTISIHSEHSERVRNAAVNFIRRLSARTGVFFNEGFPLENKKGTIQISYDEVVTLNLKADESYTLNTNDSLIEIKAQTDLGALRGLQTLLQLTDHNSSTYFFPGISIFDAPRFVWRGLMIDVSRHFHPVNVIKRNLDAMASMKMNVFHWHLTDDQGFRIESKAYPKLQELASDGLFYTQEQIKEVVTYADHLGIRVIPEIDVPGHASAILTAYPELGSKADYHYAIERFSGVFDPTLNPTLDTTYVFLETLFAEITPLFPDKYFHIGGDENEGKHWNENQEIQKFKKKHKLKTNHDLQTYFNIKLEKILNKLGKKLMGWDEIMTPDMPTSAVIHSWRGENEGLPNGGSLIAAAKKGYQTVLSNGYYIDRMLSVEHHYSNDPIKNIELTPEERSRILGGEATMWSELVTSQTIDSRIWPRTAAIAERFWSSKDVNDVENMRKRLKTVSFRLEELELTHIKNKAVILRGMTNNQDISSLETLTNICEPLKVYARNKDGVEYKTYSPFNLFADACIVDAPDALIFNQHVTAFIKTPNNNNQTAVLNCLYKWAANDAQFSKLRMNPKISALNTLSKSLSNASKGLSEVLQNEDISETTIDQIQSNIDILSQEFMDTEVVIIDALNKLVSYCKTNLKTN